MGQKVDTRYDCTVCDEQWHLKGDVHRMSACPKCGSWIKPSDKQLVMDLGDESENEESNGIP